jgi:hypothetical protein
MQEQKNLRTNRVSHDVDPRAYNTVTVPFRFKPAKLSYSQDTQVYFVQLVDLQPRRVKAGTEIRSAGVLGEPKPVYDVVHVRAKTPELLRQELEFRFPNAVFTIADTDSKIKAQHKSTGDAELDAAYQASLDNRPPTRAEIDSAYERLRKEFGQPNANGFREIFNMQFSETERLRCGIRRPVFDAIAELEQARFNEGVIRQHKILSDEMTEQEREAHICHSLNSFMNSDAWSAWFRQFPNNFMSYPNQEYRNRDAVLRYCAAHGFSVPNHAVLSQAVQYLYENKMLYLKASYKRSEQEEKNSVRVFDAAVPETPIISDAAIRKAKELLGQNLPHGMMPSQEKIHEIATRIGISEEMWEAMNGRQVSVKPKQLQTVSEIKQELASIRPASTRKRASY